MAGIYRKKAIDRLSSPEQLDKMIAITQPSTWLMLLGLVILFLAITIWAFTGSIEDTYSAIGCIVQSDQSNATNSSEQYMLVSYIPYTDKDKIMVGMEVSCYSSNSNQRYSGRVVQVDQATANYDSMALVLYDEGLIPYFLQDTPVVAVKSVLELDSDSTTNNPNFGTSIMQANYITAKQKPISYVFPAD